MHYACSHMLYGGCSLFSTMTSPAGRRHPSENQASGVSLYSFLAGTIAVHSPRIACLYTDKPRTKLGAHVRPLTAALLVHHEITHCCSVLGLLGSFTALHQTFAVYGHLLVVPWRHPTVRTTASRDNATWLTRIPSSGKSLIQRRPRPLQETHIPQGPGRATLFRRIRVLMDAA